MIYETKPRPRVIVKVLVYEGDTEIRNLTKNMSDHDTKNWLINLILWATQNHKIIEILHIQDFERNLNA